MRVSAHLRLAAIAAFLLGASAQAFAESGHAVGPGCDPERRAVAYHAGSIFGAAWETPRHGYLPVPCAVVSDTTMDSAPVTVLRDGKLVSMPKVTAPTDIPAAAASRDDGAIWS